MDCTNGDLNKISAVKAQASSGTTFDVANSFIALLAFAASSFSLLATLLKPDGEFQIFGAYIEIAFFGLMNVGLPVHKAKLNRLIHISGSNELFKLTARKIDSCSPISHPISLRTSFLFNASPSINRSLRIYVS